jgi:hypothetical protein
MKTKSLILVLMLTAYNIHGQRFSHAAGTAYSQTLGTYGNSDMASILYTPKLIYPSSASYLALAAPVSYSLVVSSARSNAKPVVELPLTLEWGYNRLHKQSNALKSLFIGAGVSVFHNMKGEQASDRVWGNIYLGAGLQALGLPLEMRLQASRYLSEVPGSMTRIGIGLSYVMR